MLNWTKRPVRRDTVCGRQRRWHAVGTRYYVIESVVRGLPTVYYAYLEDSAGGRILKTHRRPRPAMETCERHARQDQLQEA